MKIDLRDKVVIVTGGARGLGAGIVERFVAEGAHAVAFDVLEQELRQLQSTVVGPGSLTPRVVDVRDSAGVDAAVAEVIAEHGRIDVLVNNAGIVGGGLIEEIDDELWQRVHDINVGGTFRLCRAVVPHMKVQRGGRIINCSSFAAKVPLVAGGLYASSKAAVTQLTRALAGELGPWDITVNAYAPGMVPTAVGRFAELPAQEQEAYLDTLTLRRWGTSEEVADLVAFLASEQASYITGTLIDVSGGKLATQRPRMAYERAAAQGLPAPKPEVPGSKRTPRCG